MRGMNTMVLRMRGTIQWRLVAVSLLMFALLIWPVAGSVGSVAAAAGDATSFSGSATVVDATVLGVNQKLGATMVFPSGSPAFSDERSLLDVAIPNLLNAQVGHASTIGKGNSSRSQSSLANLNLMVGGNTIGASFLSANARAVCGPNGPSVSGSSEIADLVINGQTIAVTGAPNQTVALPVGQVIINEQSGTSNSLNVTALHVIIPGVADVAIASVHADITCGVALDCPGQHLFVTGGGYINDAIGTKLHFAVAGRNGEAWGHVLYQPTNLHVKNPYAIVYKSLTALDAGLSAHPEFTFNTGMLTGKPGSFEGAAILYWTANGLSTGQIVGEVLVIDMGEPGRSDFFEIVGLNSGGTGLVSIAAGFLQGGNIQMHGKCL